MHPVPHSQYDRTPLHNSASRGQAEVVDLLLKAADCHINDQDKVSIKL